MPPSMGTSPASTFGAVASAEHSVGLPAGATSPNHSQAHASSCQADQNGFA